MGFWADDPLTRGLLVAIGLATVGAGGSSSSVHNSTLQSSSPSPGRRVIPAASGSLVADFFSQRQPQTPVAKVALDSAKKVYDVYNKGQKLLGLGAQSPTYSSAIDAPFAEAATLTEVSGGELALGTPEALTIFAEAAPLVQVSGGEIAVGVTTGATAGSTSGGTSAAGAGAATAGATVTGEITLMGVLGPLGIMAGITAAVATGIHYLIKGLLPSDLPYGRGRVFSAADNMSSQKSKLLGMRGGDAITTYIKNHRNFNDLVRLAGSGPNLSPHGEVLFHHPTAGLGGDFMNHASPDYLALLTNVYNHNVAALNEFVRGVEIYTGETGATHPHWEATDWYRRSLVSCVPADVRKALYPLDTIWQPMPGYQTMAETLTAYLFPGGYVDQRALEDVNAAGGIDVYLSKQVGAPWGGCPYFRDTSLIILTQDQADRIARMWPERVQSAIAENDQRWLAYSQSGGDGGGDGGGGDGGE